MKGQQLKSIRAELGWSQSRLAAELGVKTNTVARWERNERSIRAPIAKLIETVRTAAQPKGRK